MNGLVKDLWVEFLELLLVIFEIAQYAHKYAQSVKLVVLLLMDKVHLAVNPVDHLINHQEDVFMNVVIDDRELLVRDKLVELYESVHHYVAELHLVKKACHQIHDALKLAVSQ